MATITGTFNSLVSGTLSGVIGTPGPTGSTGPQGPAGPTFTGGAITSPITYTVGTNTTVFENGDIYTENTASGAYGVVYINGLEASDGTHTLTMTASGITFGDASVQSTAFPGSAAFYPATGNPSGFLTSAPVTSVAGRTGAITLSSTDISGLGTMATATASDYSTTTAANALYYPLSGNPSGFLADAPSDGTIYGRQDGDWVAAGGGGGSYLPLAGGTMTGSIIFDGTSGQYISKGNFDTSRGGNYGISLVCSIGYEFNWQAGWLTTTEQSSVTPRPLYLDSLAGTTLRAWNSAADNGVEVSHTGINVANATPYYVNVAPDLVKVFEATNELGVSIAHDSIAIQHIDTPDRTSYFTNEYIGFEDMSGTPHSAWIEHDVITVQDASNTTQMRSDGISLSAAGSITFGDSTVQTTAGIEEAPMDNNPYVRFNGVWVTPPYQYVGNIVMIGTDITNTSSWYGAPFYLGRNGNVVVSSNNFSGELYIGAYLSDKATSTYPSLNQLTTINNFGFNSSIATNPPQTVNWTSLTNVDITYNLFETAPSFSGCTLITITLDNNPSMVTAPYLTDTSLLSQVTMIGCAVSSYELLSCLSQIYNYGGDANNGYFDCSGGNNGELDPDAIEITQLQDAGWTVVFNSI